MYNNIHIYTHWYLLVAWIKQHVSNRYIGWRSGNWRVWSPEEGEMSKGMIIWMYHMPAQIEATAKYTRLMSEHVQYWLGNMLQETPGTLLLVGVEGALYVYSPCNNPLSWDIIASVIPYSNFGYTRCPTNHNRLVSVFRLSFRSPKRKST